MEKNVNHNKHKRIPRAQDNLEVEVWNRGCLVCGIDEVGRGCLAGPVVTSAVVLYAGKRFSLLKDSKLLSMEERVRAARWIKKNSWYAYGIVSHQEIDRYNIYQATMRAMKRATLHVVSQLSQWPNRIIVDAMPLIFAQSPLKDIELLHFTGAEQKSISVAAASILAKVKRDELMKAYGRIFPGYALAKHKGYATMSHRTLIGKEGRSIIHRVTFLKNFEKKGQEVYEEQISLFSGGD